MLKGVHKNIIEISDTGNQYFEKAILFVSEDKELDNSKLKQEAKRYMGGIDYRPKICGLKNGIMWNIIKLGSASAFGAAIMAIILKI